MARDYIKQPLRIFIAVGHGGPDPGTVNKALGLTEAGINLSIALLMQRDLRRHGVQVKLSRSVDEEDRLKEEIAECNAYNPDFAVAVHTNAGGGTGFEVYYQLEPWEHTKASVEMAQLFDNNVSKYLAVNTRGLKSHTCRSVLLEGANFVHLRQFAVSLGFKVAYDAATKQIRIVDVP